jgi:uncharacterized protein YuzE
MAVETGEPFVNLKVPESFLSFLPVVLESPEKRVYVTYDEGADVLYINFRQPSFADDSSIKPNGAILRYYRKELIGVTILDASKYGLEKKE